MDAFCTREIRSRIVMAMALYTMKRSLMTGNLILGFRKKLRGVAFKSSIICHMVTDEEVLRRVDEKRSILITVIRRKAYWIVPILKRDCLVLDVIERKLERTSWFGKRPQSLGDLREEGYTACWRQKPWLRGDGERNRRPSPSTCRQAEHLIIMYIHNGWAVNNLCYFVTECISKTTIYEN